MDTLNFKLKTRTLILDSNKTGAVVTNPVSGESTYLNPDAKSIYEWLEDTIQLFLIYNKILENLTTIHEEVGNFGADDMDELMELFEEARSYFQNEWPDESSILLGKR